MLNQSQPAEIVRVAPHEGKFTVAVQFVAAKTDAVGEKKRGYASHQGTPARTEPFSEPRQSVLAVESDVRVADMMRNVLGQDGYTVHIVKTAKEALDFLRMNVPDVFIAEVECEGISGHDLCAIVKRSERLQRVPVILLTRSAQPADYSASHQMGAVVCMAKPFQPDRLAHVVRLVAPPPTTKELLRRARLRLRRSHSVDTPGLRAEPSHPLLPLQNAASYLAIPGEGAACCCASRCCFSKYSR